MGRGVHDLSRTVSCAIVPTGEKEEYGKAKCDGSGGDDGVEEVNHGRDARKEVAAEVARERELEEDSKLPEPRRERRAGAREASRRRS